ncbi:MAG: hypothetical protein V1676_06110 [Candidatus Diapherotrites archaeon]
MSNEMIGMLLIGVAVGMWINFPTLPEPLSAVNPFVGFAFFLAGILLYLKK